MREQGEDVFVSLLVMVMMIMIMMMNRIVWSFEGLVVGSCLEHRRIFCSLWINSGAA